MQNYFQDLSFTNTTTQAPQTQLLYHLLRNQRKITQLTLDGDAKTFLNYTNIGELWVSLIRQQGLWIGRFGKEGWLQLVMQCENKLKSFWTKNTLQGYDASNWKIENWDAYNRNIALAAIKGACTMRNMEFVSKTNFTIYRYADISSNISVKSNVDISNTVKLYIDNVHFAAIKHPLVEDLYIFPETVVGVLSVPLILQVYKPAHLVGCTELNNVSVDYIKLDNDVRRYFRSPDIAKCF